MALRLLQEAQARLPGLFEGDPLLQWLRPGILPSLTVSAVIGFVVCGILAVGLLAVGVGQTRKGFLGVGLTLGAFTAGMVHVALEATAAPAPAWVEANLSFVQQAHLELRGRPLPLATLSREDIVELTYALKQEQEVLALAETRAHEVADPELSSSERDAFRTAFVKELRRMH
jgi:hypothetical protein